MPLTTLDPITALIVVDLQKGVVGMPTAHPVANVIDRSSRLADAFRRHGLPVVLVNVDAAPAGRTDRGSRIGGLPADWVELVPELNRQPSDITVTKHTMGAWVTTGLHDILGDLGVTQVVVTGIATSSGVEATARVAHEYGYNVTLAVDAMTDSSAEAHAAAVTYTFPKIGESGTTAEVLELLETTRR